MPVPFAPLAIMAGSAIAGYASNMYSQAKQRELYRYQRAGYERQWNDYKRRLHGRPIVYPEFSFPGKIRALDTGISQSYSASLGSSSRLLGSFAGGTVYGRSITRSLYGKSAGRSSRYL